MPTANGHQCFHREQHLRIHLLRKTKLLVRPTEDNPAGTRQNSRSPSANFQRVRFVGARTAAEASSLLSFRVYSRRQRSDPSELRAADANQMVIAREGIIKLEHLRLLV
ncbi:hypothetical protein EVAR_8223_1 [Eumeta japonica]|uniref:Uncharacterized protein n=1 Tax=Eumeta variegata TaxID=151549 RepID=A0A4C1TGP0_EUMVA|nr:hypothetical protein EVAR_8223_1 [Eumeta japonica]